MQDKCCIGRHSHREVTTLPSAPPFSLASSKPVARSLYHHYHTFFFSDTRNLKNCKNLGLSGNGDGATYPITCYHSVICIEMFIVLFGPSRSM